MEIDNPGFTHGVHRRADLGRSNEHKHDHLQSQHQCQWHSGADKTSLSQPDDAQAEDRDDCRGRQKKPAPQPRTGVFDEDRIIQQDVGVPVH